MQNHNVQTSSKKSISLNNILNKFGKSKKNTNSAITLFFNTLLSNLKSNEVTKQSGAVPLLSKSSAQIKNNVIDINKTPTFDFSLLSDNLDATDHKDINLLSLAFTSQNTPDIVNKDEFGKISNENFNNRTSSFKQQVSDINTGSTFESFITKLTDISKGSSDQTKLVTKLLAEPVSVQKTVYTILKEISKLANAQNPQAKHVDQSELKEIPVKGLTHKNVTTDILDKPNGVLKNLKAIRKENEDSKELFIGKESIKNKIIIELKSNSVTIKAHKSLKKQLSKASHYLKHFVRNNFVETENNAVLNTKHTRKGSSGETSEKTVLVNKIKKTSLGKSINNAQSTSKVAKIVQKKGHKIEEISVKNKISVKNDSELLKPEKVVQKDFNRGKSELITGVNRKTIGNATTKVIDIKGQKDKNILNKISFSQKTGSEQTKPKHTVEKSSVGKRSKLENHINKTFDSKEEIVKTSTKRKDPVFIQIKTSKQTNFVKSAPELVVHNDPGEEKKKLGKKISNSTKKQIATKIIHESEFKKETLSIKEDDFVKDNSRTVKSKLHVQKNSTVVKKEVSKLSKEQNEVKISSPKELLNREVPIKETVLENVDSKLFKPEKTINNLNNNGKATIEHEKSNPILKNVEAKNEALKTSTFKIEDAGKNVSGLTEENKKSSGSIKNLAGANIKNQPEKVNIEIPPSIIADRPVENKKIDFNVNKNLKIKFVYTNDQLNDTVKPTVVKPLQKRVGKIVLPDIADKKFTINEVFKLGSVSTEIIENFKFKHAKSVPELPHLVNDLVAPKVNGVIKKTEKTNNNKIKNTFSNKADEPIKTSDVKNEKVDKSFINKGFSKASLQAGFPSEQILNKFDLTKVDGPEFESSNQIKEVIKNEVASAPSLEDLTVATNNQATKIITGVIPKMVTPVKYLSGIIPKFYDSANNTFTQSQVVVDGGEMGKLDIRLNKNSTTQSILILVENDTIKTEIARILPHLTENLQSKGLQVSAVNIDVGQSWNKNNKRQNGRDNTKTNYSQTPEGTNDQDTTINSKRYYGYNTMDIIA